MVVYLLCSAYDYELPIAPPFEHIALVARYLNKPYSTISDAVYNGSVIDKKYIVERVFIDGTVDDDCNYYSHII